MTRSTPSAPMLNEDQRLALRVAQLSDRLWRTCRIARLREQRHRDALVRDLHDGPAQLLGMIRSNLLHIANTPPSQVPRERLSELLALTDEAIESVQTTISGGRTHRETIGDLARALRALIRRLGPALMLHISAELSPSTLDLGPVRAAAVVAGVREALVNAVRHGRATEALVRTVVENGCLLATVTDNGHGLGARSPNRGTGIGVTGLRDRVAMLGGYVTLADAPMGGAVLTLCLPAFAPLQLARA